MKTYVGSIQRKGRRYYLVMAQNGRQRWLALRTSLKPVARIRAAMLAPADSDNETLWLQQLVRLGDNARHELSRRRFADILSWDRLWNDFEALSPGKIPSASRPSYERWVQLLIDAVAELRLKVQGPVQLSHCDAQQVAALLARRYVSAKRMLVFYHRVWRTLSLDDAVWKDVRVAGKASEYYRRLSVEEVKRLIAYFTSTGRQAYADMVTIGFYTGLRLSDVAELEVTEVAQDGAFLHIQPNKVRNSKARTLSIPLISRARSCVRRRLDEATRSKPQETDARLFLFPSNVRRRPSRQLSAAFRACHVLKQGSGRASFHSLRATFISMMDESGIPPHVTDAITGHAGGGMHARYTQPTPAALLAAVQRALPEL